MITKIAQGERSGTNVEEAFVPVLALGWLDLPEPPRTC
jgi:hypothetical protein